MANLIVASPIVVVNKSVPARNVRELIDLAKSKPGAISFANGGIGGSSHLPTVMFERAAGIKLLHVS